MTDKETKVLLVYGDDDYSALTPEQESDMTVEEAFNKAQDNGGRFSEEIDGQTIEFRAYVFGEVCPKFEAFVRERIHDYDRSKHTEYYVVPNAQNPLMTE